MSDPKKQLSKLTLKQIRKSINLTQKEFSHKLGIAERTLQDWERGKRSIRFSVVQIVILEDMLTSIGKNFSDLAEDLSNRNTHSQ